MDFKMSLLNKRLPTDGINFITNAFVVAIGIVVVTGFMVPIYSDEVAYLISRAGLFREDGVVVGLFPQCGSQWLSELSAIHYPGALIYSLLYPSNNALLLRASGILVFIFWLIATWLLCRSLFESKGRTAVNVWVMSIGLVFIGVVPYTMLMARPESLLSLCMVIFAIFAYAGKLSDKICAKNILLIGLFLSLYSLFLYAHPKSVFFIPFVLICAVFFARCSGWLGWAFIAFLVVISSISVFKSLSVTQCDGSIYVSKMLSRHVVDYRLAWAEPLNFFFLLIRNFFAAIYFVSKQVVFSSRYQSSWLAGADIGYWVNNYVNPFLVVLVMVCFVIIFTRVFLLLGRIKKITVRRESVSLVVCLLLCLSFNMAFYSPSIWNFYSASFVLAVLSLASIMLHSVLSGPIHQSFAIRYADLTIVGFALISLAVFFCVNLPSVYKVFKRGDPFAMGQFISAPVIPADSLVGDIRLLAKKCNLQEGASRLVIDQGSYSAFGGLKQPIFSLYISPLNYGKDIKSLRSFLANLGSSGVVSRCKYLSQELLDLAYQSHDYCCLSGQMLRKD